jgi:hypothetical protein
MVGDSVLDCPVGEVPDPDALIRAAMQWHFDAATGSRFWLEKARTLDFDPRTDVHGFADLKLFPNVVNELRDARVEDLIPRGYSERADLYGVFESSATTGAPKHVVAMTDWMRRWLAFDSQNMDDWGLPHDLNWLRWCRADRTWPDRGRVSRSEPAAGSSSRSTWIPGG